MGCLLHTLNFSLRVDRRWRIAAFPTMLLLIAGCPGFPGTQPPPDGGGDGSGGSITAEIITPSSSFGISLLDPPVQVRFSVPTTATDVRGFRIPVADLSPNSAPIGDRTVVATDLDTGTNRFFDFEPQEAGVGFFRVGIIYVTGGQEKSTESQAVIQVEGPPDPVFILPVDSIAVVQEGESVTVTFDCRDSEGEVQWRLFYLSSADSRTVPADRLGTQLAVGSGNVGTFTFQTAGLDADDYTLGLSATDSGASISATVAAGQNDRIVTIPDATRTTPIIRVTNPSGNTSPTITITAPGATDVTLYKDDPYTIRFVGAVFEAGATGAIEVFYDSDTNVTNGFTLIDDELPVQTATLAFPSDVPAGTYYIGATIRDGINNPVSAYSTGRITVVRNVTLSVTEPNTSLSVAPGSSVNVAWTTNAPDSSGTVDVFAQAVDSSGLPFGAEIAILTGAAMKTRSTMFSSATPGLFQLSVRLNLRDGITVLQTAPKNLRVSSLPPIIWLGAIAETNPRIDGAVFGGVNFEDNAGTAFAPAGDLDDDGLDEFVISARYGKPFFVNPNGTGPGEAYLIYGERGTKRLVGSYNLNSVGISVRGVTLTGIRTVGNSSDTDGLADIVAIPDADGDSKGELAFGFPRTNSAKMGTLDLAGQFLSGGVVILSSANSLLADPTGGTPVINLDLAGQRFSNQTVTPGGIAAAVRDDQRFQAGTPPAPNVCVAGQDSFRDTIFGPGVGFTDRLAPPLWEQEGFPPIAEGTPPANGVCPTLFAIPPGPCSPVPFSELNAGSGFYPSTGTPLEPLGARVFGRDANDRFGTSLTISQPLGEDGPTDLVITSPSRSASTDEVSGIDSDIEGAGVAYLSANRNLWGVDPSFPGTPPRPHQYIDGEVSHCGTDVAPALDATRIAGDAGDGIQNVLGIGDFNGDGRADIAVGAPTSNGGQGRVYIAFRRDPDLESDFVLNKLALAPDNPDRLDGVLISSGSVDGLGSSLAGGFDFNGDNIPDLVIGSPNADGGTGEVVVVFGGTGIISQAGGISLQALLSQTRTANGGPVAARIKGNTVDSEKGLFGFNIANGGDVDGDGTNDLLIAAPDASPRFDNDPNNGVDALTALGVDVDLDGVRDEIPGDDELRQAGLVYVVYGSNRLDQLRTCTGTTTPCTTSAECTGNVSCALNDVTIGIDQLGTARLRGLIVAGRRSGDRIGGGDAGDSTKGGIVAKQGRGRSRGLAGAGDVDGDGRSDLVIGSILADPRRDPNTGVGVQNGGETYLVYGSNVP